MQVCSAVEIIIFTQNSRSKSTFLLLFSLFLHFHHHHPGLSTADHSATCRRWTDGESGGDPRYYCEQKSPQNLNLKIRIGFNREGGGSGNVKPVWCAGITMQQGEIFCILPRHTKEDSGCSRFLILSLFVFMQDIVTAKSSFLCNTMFNASSCCVLASVQKKLWDCSPLKWHTQHMKL